MQNASVPPTSDHGGLLLFTLLTAGFLLGLRHALEPDHLAVVSALAARRDASRDFLRHGLIWSTGHASTLLMLTVAALALGGELPAGLDRAFHAVVALLLLALGVATLRAALQAQGPAQQAGALGAHRPDHVHDGDAPARLRTLLVGAVQGLAGSGAFVLLAMDATGQPAVALGYVALFGLGSIVGMALVALLLSVPLARATSQIRGFNRWLSLGAALLMIAVAIGALRAL